MRTRIVPMASESHKVGLGSARVPRVGEAVSGSLTFSCCCNQKKSVAAKTLQRKNEGRLRFRKRPSYFDGGKPNSVGVIAHADDHLSHPDFSESPMKFRRS